MRAVSESGYTPNNSARTLRTQRSRMVLVVVPSVANQMYAHVLRGIDTGLAPAGYGVIIGNLDNAPNKEGRFVDFAFARQVDGVILLCGFVPGSHGRSMASAGLPMVSILSPIVDSDIPDVGIDDHAAGREAARHLARLGHRRLGYAAGPREHVVDTARWTSFREGALAEGVDPADIVRIEGGEGMRYTYRSGVAAGERFLAMTRRPTAVFCGSDEIAIGFMKVMRDAGVSVPEDVSVMGIDGIEQTDYTHPVLTTIRQPRQDLGRAGAELLLGMMDGRSDAAHRRVRLPFEFLARASTGAPPAEAAGRISQDLAPARMG
nr:substrate-binding domain-containing protein [Alsobacter ponti]